MIKKIIPCILLIFLTFSTLFAGTREVDTELVQAARELGKKYALIIGVEYSGVRELKWTVDDAVEVGWLLEKEFGFDVTCAITRYPKDKERKKKAAEINAKVGVQYTDKEGISNLIDALEEKSRSDKDQVLVYFSGHGRAYGDSGKVGYLIPSKGDWKRRTYTLINMRRFDDLAENLTARHALFVVDSCFSGIVGAFSTMDYQNPRAMQARDVKRLMGSSARQILTAGETGQKASMDPRERMSAFSFYFKRALEVEAGYPRADFTKDGLITAAELHLYLSDPLKKTWDQDPCFFNFTKNSGQFVFVPKGFETRPLKSSETTTSVSLFQPDKETPGRSSIQEIETKPPIMEGAGYLYITAEPAGVKARITTPDGKNYENECPVRLKNLPGGVYVASLSRPMYHSEKITLKVGVGVSKAHVELRPNFGRLSVTSNPEGADVFLDGDLTGSTPLTEKIKKSGVYALKVRSRRYHDYEKEVAISDEKLTTVHAMLKPAFGTFEVKIMPRDAAGAKVLLDEESVGEAVWDKQRGTVLFRNELISGRYLLSLKNDWYAPVVNQEVVIQDGKTTKKSYRLKPVFGKLNVESQPSAATVHVDGKIVGSTPIKDLKLGPGKHKIMVDKDQVRWIPKPYFVTIMSGDALNISANLDRKTGGVTVDVDPVIGNANVFLKGENKSRGTAPCTIENLETGSYTVICLGKRGDKKVVGSKNVTVEWAQIKNVVVALKDEFPPVLLRSRPMELSEDDVKRMLAKYNFFDKGWNKTGGFENDFKDNGNGTVTDRATGLMWQQSGSDHLTSDNYRVRTYIDNLNRKRFAGYGDWRLPTMEELCSLMEPEKMNGDLYINPIFDRKQRWFWSADNNSSGFYVWTPGFGSGVAVNKGSLNSGRNVRAVRSLNKETARKKTYKTKKAELPLRSKGRTLSENEVKRMFVKHNFFHSNWNKTGNFKNDFEYNGNDTVTDRATDLMWQQFGSDVLMNYDEAQKYIFNLNREKFAGYRDWRLPTLEELASLMEKDYHVYPIFGREQDWYGSADKSTSGAVWVAYFRYSEVYKDPDDGDFYVRAVRSRQ